MTKRVIESWLLLVYLDWLMRTSGFVGLQEVVRSEPIQPRADKDVSTEALSRAMDMACVFYMKRVLCLQRSAATTLLLRRHGRSAEMVIGAQMLPFLSHAWVEVDGDVVNDKPYVHEMFQVLDRC
jgi:hypothetical protein